MSARNSLAVLISACLAAATVMPVMPAAAQPLRLAPSELALPDAGASLVKYRGKVHAGRPHVRPGRPGVRPGRPGVRPGWGAGWRPPHGAWGPGSYRPGWGWYRPGWGWGYYNNTGAWIAAGVAAAAVGAAAVGAANAANNDAVAYCMQRFRSYNPNTGLYTGYDGLKHPCP